MNWHDCVNTINFHNSQSLKKTPSRNTGARFEQIWFADDVERAEDYFYNLKDNTSKKEILDNYDSSAML